MNASPTTDRTQSFARALVLVFAPFAGGYFFSYLFRSVNAIVAPDLISELGVDAEQLGLIAAAYFLSFAICQVPLGVLLDRYGSRRVQGILYMLAAVGALLFAMAESVTTLFVARALIGIGVSGGLMAALKSIVQWFPEDKIPIVKISIAKVINLGFHAFCFIIRGFHTNRRMAESGPKLFSRTDGQ